MRKEGNNRAFICCFSNEVSSLSEAETELVTYFLPIFFLFAYSKKISFPFFELSF